MSGASANHPTPKTVQYVPSASMISGGTIRVWDAIHGELRAQLRGHHAPVTRLSADDSEERLVSTDAGGVVRLWPAPRDEGMMDDLERADLERE